jgi:hypothetical protein
MADIACVIGRGHSNPVEGTGLPAGSGAEQHAAALGEVTDVYAVAVHGQRAGAHPAARVRHAKDDEPCRPYSRGSQHPDDWWRAVDLRRRWRGRCASSRGKQQQRHARRDAHADNLLLAIERHGPRQRENPRASSAISPFEGTAGGLVFALGLSACMQ